MIQPLRTAHRRIFIALAVILTAIFIAAVWAQRAPTPKNSGSAPAQRQP
jgi:hypothetical protein